MSPRAVIAVAIATAALGACAATSQVAWAPRPDANFGADKADCTKMADDVDIDSPSAYAGGRYGIASAMASRLDESSVQGGTVQRTRDAVFDDCMVRKGWKHP